jgi:diadenosine tetraphosphate (Ap4A) HIT family hydrolase
MTSDCLFCRLLRGDLPGYRVYEDDRFTVLLTIFPINPGHLMVVTNEHIESFYGVEDDLYTALMLLVKRMALVIKQVFTPLQVVMETSGIGNRHVHIHVLPVYGLYDRVPRETLDQQLANPAPEADLNTALRALRQSLAVRHHD